MPLNGLGERGLSVLTKERSIELCVEDKRAAAERGFGAELLQD